MSRWCFTAPHLLADWRGEGVAEGGVSPKPSAAIAACIAGAGLDPFGKGVQAWPVTQIKPCLALQIQREPAQGGGNIIVQSGWILSPKPCMPFAQQRFIAIQMPTQAFRDDAAVFRNGPGRKAFCIEMLAQIRLQPRWTPPSSTTETRRDPGCPQPGPAAPRDPQATTGWRRFQRPHHAGSQARGSSPLD